MSVPLSRFASQVGGGSAFYVRPLALMSHFGLPAWKAQPPIGVAWLACLVSFGLIYWVARPVVMLLAVWWVELLVYALIPVAVSFIILYRSCWHQEITGVARTCS